jgi:hypothetical protein
MVRMRDTSSMTDQRVANVYSNMGRLVSTLDHVIFVYN